MTASTVATTRGGDGAASANRGVTWETDREATAKPNLRCAPSPQQHDDGAD